MRYNNGFPGKDYVLGALEWFWCSSRQAHKASNFADLGGLQIAVPYWYHAQYCAADGVEACRVKTSD